MLLVVFVCCVCELVSVRVCVREKMSNVVDMPLGNFFEFRVYGETDDAKGVEEYFRKCSSRAPASREAFEERNVSRTVSVLRPRNLTLLDLQRLINRYGYPKEADIELLKGDPDLDQWVRELANPLSKKGFNDALRKKLENPGISNAFKAMLTKLDNERGAASDKIIQVLKFEDGSQYIRTERNEGEVLLNGVKVICRQVTQMRVEAGDAVDLFISGLGLMESTSYGVRGTQWRHGVSGVSLSLFTLKDTSPGLQGKAFVEVSIVSGPVGKDQAQKRIGDFVSDVAPTTIRFMGIPK